MSVQRAQQEITSAEFIEWIAYLDEDINRFHRQDYYLAQIAAEIRRSFVKNPVKIKISSFLMKFKGKEKVEKLSIKEKTKRAKAFWGVMMKFPKRKE